MQVGIYSLRMLQLKRNYRATSKVVNVRKPNLPLQYYDKIQGQFGFTECDLVIYTTKGIHISSATFDNAFFSKMLDSLFFFLIQFNVPFKIISLIETSQSIGGAKREYPGKTTCHTRKQSLSSHMWPVQGSNLHQTQR